MPFTLVGEANIPEISSLARLYTHDKSGARLMTLSNDDENKAFGITFPTPPATSNGIAHILEHSVLGGSRKFPVKEPFVELVKGSFKTFLNAMTFPDKTAYPVASTNVKDFYNLIDVYLDAVFYPNLTEHKFQQEGWHYELASPDAPLTLKGVVLNEMKGEYSSPDRLSYVYSQRALFPDNGYGLDSGGDPAVIPDLTYAEFRSFHEKYYHPSNAYIWFYGDDPEVRRLKYLDAWLNAYDARPVDALVPPQARWKEPRREVYHYDSGDSPEAKSYLTVNWLLDGGGDVQTDLGLGILSHILTGTPGSPLRKALMDSGLGEDLAGAGFQDDLRQICFSEGMRGVASADLPRVEALILETLKKLASDGLDPEAVAASMNTIEFHLREQNTGQFPRGLALMFGALSRWIYGGDPMEALSFEAPLEAIKDQIHREQGDGTTPGGRYFESLIRQHLLENSHRVTVSLEPDPEEGKRREQAEQERLERAKSALSTEQTQQVIDHAMELKRLQEMPDSPEALATLPYLQRSDLEPNIKRLPIEIRESQAGAASVLYHDLPTNGIVYLDLGFNLRALPADLLPFAGILGRLLLEMGTQTEDYVKLSQRIGRETGGIWASSITAASAVVERSALWFFLRGKSTVPNAGALLDILGDLLLTATLDNRDRFKQIVVEEKSGLEAALVPSGHSLVNSRLRARLSEEGWASEQMGGLEHLFFLRGLIERMDEDWPSVLDQLEMVRRLLINREAMIANVTLDATVWESFAPQLDRLLASLPRSSAFFNTYPANGSTAKRENEGLTIPAQVNYVGEGFNLFKAGYKLHGSALVTTKYLRATYLWDKIRVQGGAYGAYSLFDTHSGVFTFLSYRDPNLLATLQAYDGAAEFLRSIELSEGELTKAIIGTISDLDAYLLPDAKGWASMTRHLIGYSDEMRQRIRDDVLSTTAADFHAFGDALAEGMRKAEIVVLGSADAIARVNAEKQGLLAVKDLL